MFVFTPIPSHFAPEENLGTIKGRLALVLGKDPDDIRLFPYLTDAQKLALHEQQMESKRLALEETMRARREARKTKKRGVAAKEEPVITRVELTPKDIDPLIIPPMPENVRIDQLGLSDDAVLFFVYRVDPDSEVFEQVHVPGLQESD